MSEKTGTATSSGADARQVEDTDALAKKMFLITFAGSALFIGTVFTFVLL